MSIWIWSILDKNVGIQPMHQRHIGQDDYIVRFPSLV